MNYDKIEWVVLETGFAHMKGSGEGGIRRRSEEGANRSGSSAFHHHGHHVSN